jgi:hypothetical protein
VLIYEPDENKKEEEKKKFNIAVAEARKVFK